MKVKIRIDVLECLPSVEVRCCAGVQCLMSFIRV